MPTGDEEVARNSPSITEEESPARPFSTPSMANGRANRTAPALPMSTDAALLCSFQLWTLKYAGLHEHDIGVHSYQQKPAAAKSSILPFLHSSAAKEKDKAIYYDEFSEYFASRSLPMHLSNRIFQNLRDKLIELDQLLATLKLVRTIWLRPDVVFLIFSNGTFVFLHLEKGSRTLKHLHIDKTGLSKKFHIDAPIADFYLNSFGFYVIYESLSKIDLFHFRTPVKHFHAKFNLTNESTRLISEELPPYTNEIPVRRFFHIDHEYRTLTVWWTMLAEGLSTTTVTEKVDGDQRKAKFNCLAVVFHSENDKEKICTVQTETVNPFFCSATPSGLTTVEMLELSEKTGPDRQYEICIFYYENFRSVPLRLVHLPKVYSPIQFVLRSSSHTIICLMDSTLISIDEINHVQRSKAAVLTRNLTGLWWLIENLLFAVADQHGSLVFYDIALNPIWPVLSSFDKLNFQQQLHIDQWVAAVHSSVTEHPSISSSNVTLLLQFSASGPIGLMDLHYPFETIHSLLKFYVNSHQFQSAVDLFWCIDWSKKDDDARCALSYISQEFFRHLKTNQYVLIEELLRTFYAPLRPISDASILRNRAFVNQIARKFFYVLLREKSFSKALLLAKHLDERTIFLDLFYAADANNERTILNVCAEKLALNDTEKLDEDDEDESGLSVTSSEDENESDRTVQQRFPPANNSIFGDVNEIVTSAIEDYQLDENMYKFLLDRLHVT